MIPLLSADPSMGIKETLSWSCENLVCGPREGFSLITRTTTIKMHRYSTMTILHCHLP